jgi:hypothetical protein
VGYAVGGKEGCKGAVVPFDTMKARGRSSTQSEPRRWMVVSGQPTTFMPQSQFVRFGESKVDRRGGT